MDWNLADCEVPFQYKTLIFPDPNTGLDPEQTWSYTAWVGLEFPM